MKKHTYMLMSGEKPPAKKPSKTHAERLKEAQEREKRSNDAAARLASAMGLPVPAARSR